MLTVYRSNRAEWLSAVLSEQLRLNPPDPFETIDVIVNTWPTSRWLSEQIAIANGISAQISFPFPNAHLTKLVQLYLGLEVTGKDPWRASQLVWTIVEVLPELLEKKEAKTIVNRTTKHRLKQKELNKQIWELANSLTNTIEEYILYRPETIQSWWEGTDKFNDKTQGVRSEFKWQATLINLLKQKIKTKPICLQIIDVINRLKNRENPQKRMPNELMIFGVSSLAPIQIDLLQALSSIMKINIFLLTPCKDLWKRSKERRAVMGSDWQIPTDGSWLIKSPRLEANFGRMGAEFQQLLEGSGECQLGEWKEEDLFSMPTQIAFNNEREPTLLEQLQESLLTQDSKVTLSRQSSDNSISFIASPGNRRQVQLIRDQIIQWLAQDDDLQPRDIIVMTPQITTLAPLIASVFNDVSSTKTNLPWRITDRTQLQKPGIIQFMVDLIDNSTTKLTSVELIQLLSNNMLQEKFDFDQEEVEKMIKCLHNSGFRWGVDEADRNGDASNSLSWCLERWLLGIVLPSTPGLAPQAIAPFSGTYSLNELEKWWGLLSKIKTHLQSLRVSKTCNEWSIQLLSILNDLFTINEQWSWEHEAFYSHVKQWQSDAGNCKLKIEASVLGDILRKYISLESGKFGHRSGKITFSALEPMRAIPYKIIILMGLDNSIFPYSEDRASYSLLEYKRLLGDPKSTDKDRYVLLEALMSTREKILITWNSRDEKDGESLEPATPIQQWIDFLRNELEQESFKGIIKAPASNPLSYTNFISNKEYPALSCDTRDLEARLYIDKESKVKPSALALPINWEFDFHDYNKSIKLNFELINRWLRAPQLTWLEQLDIKPKANDIKLESKETYELSELERYSLLKEKFIEYQSEFLKLNGQCTSNVFNNWKDKVKGQGILPPKSAAEIECELLESRWQSISDLVKSMGPQTEYVLELENESMRILLANEMVLIFEIGKLQIKSIMSTWLKHLYVCAYDIYPRKTIIISRGSSTIAPNKYNKSLEFKPISKDEAMSLLSNIKLLTKQGLINCWPVPPNSGWELYKAKHLNKSSYMEIFKKKWEGGYKISAERENEEMEICFGTKCESKVFLENNVFEECLFELYDPIIRSIIL